MNVKINHVKADSELVFDVKKLDKIINNKTKIIYLSSPNSITGDIISVDEVSYFLKKYPKIKRVPLFNLEGFNYQCIWYKRSIIDYFSHKIFKRQTTIEIERIKRQIKCVSSYDAVWVHGLKSAAAVRKLHEGERIPLFVTWHGSSIHTDPFNDKNIFQWTRSILENANANFFVSEELLKIARERITKNFRASVTYNGVDTELYNAKYHKTNNSPVVSYIGNCLPVKNVNFLPELFNSIQSKVPDVSFIVAGGDGFYDLFQNFDGRISIFNNISRDDMPDLYAKIDLVVLPSLKEGLPMVCLEAVSSGCMFVSSNVGAISEVVGIENTVNLGPEFEDNFIKLCVKRLRDPRSFKMPDKFSLSKIVDRELSEIIRSIH